MPQAVTIAVDPQDRSSCIITSPYSARDTIRGLASRKWDADRKVWVIPAAHLEMARAALEADGFIVLFLGKTQAELDLEAAHARIDALQRQLDAALRRSAPRGDVFEALGRELPRSLHKPACRALMRVVHPDVGGDAMLAQRLNDSILGRAS